MIHTDARLETPRATQQPALAVVTSAELAAAMPVMAMATALAVAYVCDRLGLGVLPWAAGGAAAAAAAALVIGLRHTVRVRVGEMLLAGLAVAATLSYLTWLAWPALLPLGSGSDLTHHLLLIDYIERHGQLPRDGNAVEFLGEMAHYTPGLHLLAALGGSLARVGALQAVYPVVAIAAALKFGVFLLVLLRLFKTSPLRLPVATAGTLAVLLVPAYSLGSFVDDSFLAQAVSELFAVFAWWTLIVWDEQPNRFSLGLFAIAGIAIFLTWPIWIGPPVLALAALLLLHRGLPISTRLGDAALALLPIAAIALLHAAGRAAQASIVGTSGAVRPPSPANLGWWLPLLALAGAPIAIATRRHRTVTVFGGAIAVQAAALWVVASGQTPYMAIKMTYLAIYPAIACAMAFADTIGNALIARLSSILARRTLTAAAWVVVLAITLLPGGRPLPTRSSVRPVVASDLATAGSWARTHVPADCVDYLVGNEYTAYWLHLAVLGNPRISARTGNDDTFLTQPSMARWLVPGGLRYAIASLAVLPAEIRREVDILHQTGQAAVIERRGPSTCPAR